MRFPALHLSGAGILTGAAVAIACSSSPQMRAETATATATAAASATAPACQLGKAPAGSRVLVFSRTKGWRHDAIPDGIAGVTALGARLGFAVDATEDPTLFSDQSLGRYAAVVFMMTTGDVLDDAQQAAFERYVRAGHGYVGVHSASDTEYDWPWYGRLVGAYFKQHPRIQEARLDVSDRSHISTKCLPAVWTRRDEWYDFRAPPPPEVKVLMTIDETSYSGGTMGGRHPMAWYRDFDGGRSFYTELGHTHESWKEQAYLDHLAGGILWAMGAAR